MSENEFHRKGRTGILLDQIYSNPNHRLVLNTSTKEVCKACHFIATAESEISHGPRDSKAQPRSHQTWSSAYQGSYLKGSAKKHSLLFVWAFCVRWNPHHDHRPLLNIRGRCHHHRQQLTALVFGLEPRKHLDYSKLGDRIFKPVALFLKSSFGV